MVAVCCWNINRFATPYQDDNALDRLCTAAVDRRAVAARTNVRKRAIAARNTPGENRTQHHIVSIEDGKGHHKHARDRVGLYS